LEGSIDENKKIQKFISFVRKRPEKKKEILRTLERDGSNRKQG
jgi:hypothetical protein